jgi:CRISPR-associated protein Csd1
MRYFTLQQIQDYQGNLRRFSLYALINATINRDTQEKPQAQVGQALMHVALHGGQLPVSILYRVVRRIRASHRVQPEQAALIKMVLLSQPDTTLPTNERNDYMTTVSEEEKDAAYLCGRLLAELDYIQHRALGKINATIVDRFYGTASVSPAVVFPRLLKGAIPHLANMRPEHNTHAKSYSASLSYADKELARLLEHLTSFPPILTLEEQGRFALGFYHQRARHFFQGQNKTQDAGLDLTTNDADDND